jgi:hypothetical protein
MDLTGAEFEKRKTDATDVADPDTPQAGASGQAGPGRHRPVECGQPARPHRVHDQLADGEQDHPDRGGFVGRLRDDRNDYSGFDVGHGIELDVWLDVDCRIHDHDADDGGQGGHALDNRDHIEPWQLSDGSGPWAATPT